MGWAASRQASQVSHDVHIQAGAQRAHVQFLKPAARLDPGAGDQDIEPAMAREHPTTRASTAASSVTSHARPVTRRPVCADTWAAAAWHRQTDRLASTTLEPAWTSAVTISRPSPAEPPGCRDDHGARADQENPCSLGRLERHDHPF
jgi:hypothetical protein